MEDQFTGLVPNKLDFIITVFCVIIQNITQIIVWIWWEDDIFKPMETGVTSYAFIDHNALIIQRKMSNSRDTHVNTHFSSNVSLAMASLMYKKGFFLRTASEP